jgi:hypothetical protein
MPASGFAVVGIDTYGHPDDQRLYLCGQFASVEEAKAELQRRKSKSPDEAYYVYAADGSVVSE